MSTVENEAVDEVSPRRLAQADRDAQEVAERLRETSIALLEANQALARISLLEFRLEEIWQARQWLDEQNAGLRRENVELREENIRLADVIQAFAPAMDTAAAESPTPPSDRCR